jgi:two-component system, OmpR family, sensor kinase
MGMQPLPTTVSLSSPEGLALVCSNDGTVRDVVRTSLSGATLEGTLCDSVDDTSRDSCRLFLRSLSRGTLARSTPVRVGARDIHFFGLGERIVGVVDPLSAAAFAASVDGFESLAEAIRGSDATYQLYEDLARVNNELVTAQRELARSITELQRLNGYKDELLGMAAHDLRNPLSANAGFVRFLLEDAQDLDADQVMLLERLRANSNYMLRLVESVLDFAAIQSGHVRLSPEEASIEDVLDTVLAIMRVLADAKGVRILRTAGEGLPQLRLDVVKITQAIQNLVSNAVQYSTEGGLVEIRTAVIPDGVEIEVEDHGPGIPPDDLPLLFKPFTRLSAVNLNQHRSVGLGLAITRRLIEAHGGTIDVRSELGKGSTFVVRLRAGVVG